MKLWPFGKKTLIEEMNVLIDRLSKLDGDASRRVIIVSEAQRRKREIDKKIERYQELVEQEGKSAEEQGELARLEKEIIEIDILINIRDDLDRKIGSALEAISAEQDQAMKLMIEEQEAIAARIGEHRKRFKLADLTNEAELRKLEAELEAEIGNE